MSEFLEENNVQINFEELDRLKLEETKFIRLVEFLEANDMFSEGMQEMLDETE